MKNFENTFEISQDVKERLNIVPVDYDKYCKEFREIGIHYRINGYSIYVKHVIVVKMAVYVEMSLSHKSKEYKILLIYSNDTSLTLKSNFDTVELKSDQYLQDALEHLFDLHVPKKFWEIKAMLN